MRARSGQRRVTRTLIGTGAFGVGVRLAVGLVLVGLGMVVLPAPSTVAAPGINKQINFQGKVVNSNGTNIPDGTYNLEFKLYTGGTGCVSGGSSPCGGTLVWTEDWLRNSSQGVTVTDGIFQVNLGAITALPASFNNDTVWLSINLGNTNATCTPFSSCSGDGEMLPFIRFTAAPYAMNSDLLDGLDSSDFAQLNPSSAQSGSLNVTGSVQAATSLQSPLVDTATAVALSVGTGTASSVTVGRTTTPFTIQGNASSVMTATSGSNTTTVGFTAPTANRSISFPDAGGTICTTVASTCSATYQAAGSYLAKNAADTSSFAVTAANFLYGFTNSSSAVASGVLKLDNGSNTGSALLVTASGNPGSGKALIVANNTAGSPSGNLIDLQVGGTSKFAVDTAGAVTSGTVNGQTITSAASFTGTVAVATSVAVPLVQTADQSAGSTNSAAIVVRSGNATGATSNSGNVTVDAGTATGTAGTVNVGTTNASGTTVGRTGAPLTLQGNGSTVLTATNGGNTTTVGFVAPTAARSINFPNAGGTLCTDAGNCSGVGAYILNQITSPQSANIFISSASATATDPTVILRVASGQTGNPLQVQSSAGTAVAGFTNTGSLYVGTTGTFGGRVSVQTTASTNGIVIRGASSQTSDLLQLQDNSAAVTAAFGPGGNQLTLGRSAATGNVSQGKLTLQDGTTSTFGVTLQTSGSALGANRTLTLPDATGVVCLDSGNCDGTTGTGYILNQSASDQTANLRISGTARANTSVLTPLVDATTSGGSVAIGTTNATAGINLNQSTTVAAGKNLSLASGTGTFTQTYTGTSDASTITANSLTSGAALRVTSTNNSTTNTSWSAIALNPTNAQSGTAVSGANQIAGLDLQFTQNPTVAGNNETAANIAIKRIDTSVTDSTVNSILNLSNDDTGTGNQIAVTDGLRIGSAGGAASIVNGITISSTSSAVTNGLNLNGTFGTNLITSSNFTVSQAGAIVGVGVNSGTGLLQGTGGLTVTGTANINQNANNNTNINTGSSTGTVTIGGGSAPLVIDSTNFDVSSAGALSGITTISTSSTINGQTISNAASFTGTLNTAGKLTVAANGADITGAVTVNSTISGGTTYTASTSMQAPLFDTATAVALSVGTGTASSVTVGRTTTPFTIQGDSTSVITATSGANKTTVGFTAPTANRSINFSDESGTVCLQGKASCGFAIGTFLAKNAQDTSTVSVAATQYVFTNTNTGAGGVLSLVNAGTNTTLSVASSGNPTSGNALIVANNSNGTPSGNLLDLQTGGVSKFSVDTTGVTTLAALGTTNTAALVCRNSSNQLAGCNTTGTGAVFVQGGNSFGAAADLGTNDAFALNLRTSNATRLTVSTSGDLTYASGAGGFDQSASSGTFKTGTGAISLNGDITVAAGKSQTFAAGAGNFDQSLSTGTFKTGTGAVSLNGATTVANNKSFTAGGDALFKDATNSTTAFAVQNASAAPIMTVDTTANAGNLVTNGSFEVDTSGWSARTGCTLSRTTAQQIFGAAAGSCVNTATAGAGYNYALTLNASTAYVMSFYVKGSGSFSTLDFGYAPDGSTETTFVSTGNSVTATGWKRLTLSFTTGAISGTPYLFFKQSDGVARSIFIEGVQVETGSNATAYRDSRLSLNGAVTAPLLVQAAVDSNTTFAVYGSSGVQALTVDTTTSRVGIGTQNPSAKLHVLSSTTNIPAGIFRGASGQTADTFQIQDGSANVMSAFGSTGAQLTLGRIAASGTVAAGSLVLADGTTDGFGATLNTSTLTASRTISLPDAGGTICTTVASTCNGTYQAAGSYLAKNAADTSSASVVGNVYAFTNTNTGAAGVLSLSNSGTNAALSVTSASNPSAGQAVVLVNNSNGTPSGNLLDLQASSVSKFSVTAAGAVTAAGTYNTNTFTSTSLQFGGSATATVQSASGQALNVTGNAASTLSTTAGALTITSAAAATWSTSAGNLTVDSAAALNLGTGNATSVSIGKSSTTTTVNGTAQIGATAGSGALVNNGATTNTEKVLGNFASGGSIGSAATTVDIYTYISVAQTTSGQTLTIPSPTASTTYGKLVYLSNVGSTAFTLLGTTISAGTTATLVWANKNGGAGWTFAGADGSSILNQSSADQTADFRISGTGRANTSFTGPLFDALPSGALNVGTSAATGITIGQSSITTKIVGTFQVGSTAGTGALVNNGATTNTELALGNFASGGSMGSAASTVDIYTYISVAQTTASQTLTVPSPTASTTYGKMVYISNIGSTAFTLLGTTIGTGTTATLVWANKNGGAGWTFAGADGSSILNQTAADQTASFRISGTGLLGTGLQIGGTSGYCSSGCGDLNFATGSNRVLKVLAAASGSGGNNLTVQAGDGTGTNQAGGNLVLQGGAATGTGAGGVVIVKSQTNSTTAFMVQNSSGTAILTVDTSSGSGAGTVLIGDATNGASFGTSREVTYNGTARHAKTLRLNAEYAGAVLDTGGASTVTGTMTANYDSTQRMGYYKWTTSQTSAQSYDVVVTLPVPDDWSGWTGNPTFKVYTSGGTGYVITAAITKTDGTADASYNTFTILDGTHNNTTATWLTVSNPNGSTYNNNTTAPALASSGYTAGGTMNIRIHMVAAPPVSSVAQDVRIGDIYLPYLSRW